MPWSYHYGARDDSTAKSINNDPQRNISYTTVGHPDGSTSPQPRAESEGSNASEFAAKDSGHDLNLSDDDSLQKPIRAAVKQSHSSQAAM